MAQQLPKRDPLLKENSDYLNISVIVCTTVDRFLEVELLGRSQMYSFISDTVVMLPDSPRKVVRATLQTPSPGQPVRETFPPGDSFE